MDTYCIIETDNGLTVVEHPQEMTAEEAAHRHGGLVVDPGPFDSYEEACEGLLAVQDELANGRPSDVPGTQALEGRVETEN